MKAEAMPSLASAISLAMQGTSSLNYQLSGVPWESERFALGAGVDAVTGEVAKMAVDPFTVGTAPSREVQFSYEMVKTDSDVEKIIDTTTKGDYNIYGVTVEASTKFLEKLSHSETSHSLVACLTIGSPAVRVAAPSDYRLTNEAAAEMKRDPKGFRSKYGDYFISGMATTARFRVIYNFSSSDSKSLREFEAGLDISAEGLFSQGGTVKLSNQANSKRVQVSVSVSMTGLGEKAKLGDHPEPKSLTDIAGAAAWFVQNADGAPTTAQLTHYSRFDNACPTTIDVGQNVFVQLQLLYRHLWAVRSAYYSIPEIYQRDLHDRFVALDSEITSGKRTLARDPKAAKKLDDRTVDLLRDVRLVVNRMDFYRRVAGIRESAAKRPGGNGAYMVGFSEAGGFDGVTVHSASRDIKEDWHIGWREKTEDFGDGSKWLIVGMRVTPNWGDGTNGEWNAEQDNFLLEHTAGIHFKSEYDRGYDWTATCYYVDADLYQFA